MNLTLSYWGLLQHWRAQCTIDSCNTSQLQSPANLHRPHPTADAEKAQSHKPAETENQVSSQNSNFTMISCLHFCFLKTLFMFAWSSWNRCFYFTNSVPGTILDPLQMSILIAILSFICILEMKKVILSFTDYLTPQEDWISEGRARIWKRLVTPEYVRLLWSYKFLLYK